MREIVAARSVQRQTWMEEVADLIGFERLPFFESTYGSAVER